MRLSLVAPVCTVAFLFSSAACTPVGDRLASGEKPVVGEPVAGHDDAWPDVAALIYEDGYASCSGVLVAPDLVLTAAHCVSDAPWWVALGQTDYFAAAWIAVTAVVVHPFYSWDDSRPDYDIALLFLDKASDVTPRAVVTENHLAEWFQVQSSVRVVGFGAHDWPSTEFDEFKRTTRLDVSAIDCQFRTDCSGNLAFIAYGTATGNACHGDSGGPIYLDTPDGEQLVGLVSGYAWDDIDYEQLAASGDWCKAPGTYIRVDQYREWIAYVSGYQL